MLARACSESASDFDQWRMRARLLLEAGVAPEAVHWDDATQSGLWDTMDPTHSATGGRISIPARLRELLETCDCHRSPSRHAVMYRALWRTVHGRRDLVEDAADEDILRLSGMARAVNRDCHKMTAFVRFRERQIDNDTVHYMAWYEPEHRILRRAAPFFARRFGTMLWTIATPDGAAHWDRRSLAFLPAAGLPELPDHDASETLWLTYYESIFNPARLNVRAMQKEMPQKYWANLPEAKRIPALVAAAAQRAGTMVENVPAPEAKPRKRMPPIVATSSATRPDDGAIEACRRCELWERATRVVSGKGPVPARLMIVGEQPGDEEDLQGEPFVGPAGRLLKRALDDAGVQPESYFLTNTVKHFSWEPRGKRRIHKTPAQRHVAACQVWLEKEIASVRPSIIVALGGTALRALSGQQLKVGEAREADLRHMNGATIIATYHPSAVLRAADERSRIALMQTLVSDFRRATTRLELEPAP